GVMVADVLMRHEDYASAELRDPAGRYGDVRGLPLVLMAIGTVVGWGLVTNTAAGWLDWQGYFLGPFGGKDGDWAGAGLGVLFALLLGFLGTMLLGRGPVREQEARP